MCSCALMLSIYPPVYAGSVVSVYDTLCYHLLCHTLELVEHTDVSIEFWYSGSALLAIL